MAPSTRKKISNPIRSDKSRALVRYIISADEYSALYNQLKQLLPSLSTAIPSPAVYADGSQKSSADDDGACAAVRASLRVYILSTALLRLWEWIKKRVLRQVPARTGVWRSPTFRLPLSISMLLLFHRLLYRFINRLGTQLQLQGALPFRRRNPRTASALTSQLAPAIGASLAGCTLALCPKGNVRRGIGVYALCRAVEVAWRGLERDGRVWGREQVVTGSNAWNVTSVRDWKARERPWWWGRWLTMPISSGVLFWAFVLEREAAPKVYGDFIMANSSIYMPRRPRDCAPTLEWPDMRKVVDGLGTMAKLRYPKFVSPILLPSRSTLPAELRHLQPLTLTAHPMIHSLTCAAIHPSIPSCLLVNIQHHLLVVPRLLRTLTFLFTLLSVPRYKSFLQTPFFSLNRLASLIIRYAIFVSGVIGTSWASICLFQHLLPRRVLHTKRFMLGGMLGGLWSFIVRNDANAEFSYAARLATDCAWQVGRKRRWWNGIKGGDVAVFVGSLAVINAVYERDETAVDGKVARRALSHLRGDAKVPRSESRLGDQDSTL